MADVKAELLDNPKSGEPLGNNCYKVRVKIGSKGKGKSGGARVITMVLMRDELIYLLTIYDKSDKANISKSELQELISLIRKGGK